MRKEDVSAAVIALAVMLMPAFAAASEFVSPTAGGGGGTSDYELDCGKNAVVAGVSGKWGAWLDSFGLSCRKINADGTLGSSFTRGPVGGPGGNTVGNADCPADEVANSAWFTTGTYVNEVTILCGAWSAADRRVAVPSIDDHKDGVVGQDQAFTNRSRVACPTDGKPAKGFRGRRGIYVDSIALVCNDVVLPSGAGSAPPLSAGPSSAAVPSAAKKAGPSLSNSPSSAAAASAAKSAGPTFTTFPSTPVSLPASTGGDVTVTASGAAPLTITMQVPPAHASKFELVAPPTKTLGTLGSSASSSRIVRFKGGVTLGKGSAGPMTPVEISVTLTVTDAQKRATTRAFIVTAN